VEMLFTAQELARCTLVVLTGRLTEYNAVT
jgi:hypothetical protein